MHGVAGVAQSRLCLRRITGPFLSAHELQTLYVSMQMLCKCHQDDICKRRSPRPWFESAWCPQQPTGLLCGSEAPNAARVQAPRVVPRYVPDGRLPAPPAAWPTALQGSTEALPGVDYAQLAAAVAPQFDDPQTVADAHTRAIVVIHRVRHACARAGGGAPGGGAHQGRRGVPVHAGCACSLYAFLVVRA